jgi:hypothetical protein
LVSLLARCLSCLMRPSECWAIGCEPRNVHHPGGSVPRAGHRSSKHWEWWQGAGDVVQHHRQHAARHGDHHSRNSSSRDADPLWRWGGGGGGWGGGVGFCHCFKLVFCSRLPRPDSVPVVEESVCTLCAIYCPLMGKEGAGNVNELQLGFSNTTRNPEGILSHNNRKS